MQWDRRFNDSNLNETILGFTWDIGRLSDEFSLSFDNSCDSDTH